jgi:DNA end-binding protein Ku
MAKLHASIDFGLVHIPVEIVSAEERSEHVSFHMFDSKDKSRIRLKRVNENTGKEVEWEDIIKGYEIEKDKYVFFTKEELEELEEESNRSLAIDVFVDKDEIDPTLFENPYYLLPVKGSEKSYAILEKVLSESNKYAVIQAVLRGREQLGIIYAGRGGLVLEMLRYPDEVKDVSDVVPANAMKVKIAEKEISMANQLLKQMSGKFKPSAYSDHYADKLQNAIKNKSRSKVSVRSLSKTSKENKKTMDLMDLLAKSIKSGSKKESSKKRKAAA